MTTPSPTPPRPQASGFRAFLFGGLFPVILFTVVEEMYGIVAGLIVGMTWGIGEVIYEKVKFGKVDPITWGGNGLLIGLGSISLFTQEGIWFKLQPSILEAAMAVVLIGSFLAKKPVLPMMMKKQGLLERFPEKARPAIENAYAGITWRSGIFMLVHAALAAWAALYWSTRAWAFLKGVGFTLSFIVYLLVEMFAIRGKLRAALTRPQ